MPADDARRACEALWRVELPASAAAERPAPLGGRRRALGSPAAPAPGSGGEVRRLAAALRAGETSSAQLVREALARAEATDRTLGCFVELHPQRALAAARRADAELARGEDRGLLHGIPYAVKDVIDLGGTWTRLGTRGLGHRLAGEDAAVVAALARAGAIAIGTTTTHELAWGATTPQTGNPHDAARSPGGSSGGSAAAVAAGAVPFALGTDTGGSVRIPAALCGVAGLRPTHGALDLTGVAPLAPSQDTVGVLAATADDCAFVFAALAGRAALPDPVASAADSRSDGPPADTAAPPFRIGVPTDAWATRVAEDVGAVVDEARAAFAAAGAELVPVELPLAALAPAVSYVTMLAESATAWGDVLAAAPDGAGTEVAELLALGARVTARDYLRARQVARAIARKLAAAFAEHELDALLLPSTATTAPSRGTATIAAGGRREEPVEAALGRHSALASVAGFPALSTPAGRAPDDLPVGVQLLAPPGAEERLCALAATLKRGTEAMHGV